VAVGLEEAELGPAVGGDGGGEGGKRGAVAGGEFDDGEAAVVGGLPGVREDAGRQACCWEEPRPARIVSVGRGAGDGNGEDDALSAGVGDQGALGGERERVEAHD